MGVQNYIKYSVVLCFSASGLFAFLALSRQSMSWMETCILSLQNIGDSMQC